MTGVAQGPRLLQGLGEAEILAVSYASLAGLPDLFFLDDQHGARAVAVSEQYEVDPQWSPDGSYLLYTTSYGWSTRFRLIGVDGTGARLLTADDAYKFGARWSPDGSHIAFLSAEQPGDPSDQPIFLYVLDVTTAAVVQSSAAEIVDYVWLPDRGSIAAAVQTQDAIALEEYGADGSYVGRIAEMDLPAGAIPLSLSPDVRWLAFIAPRPSLDSLTDPLYVTSITGSQTNQVGEFAVDSSIVWSPDGSRMALVTLGDDFHYALYTMTVDGGEQRQFMSLDTGDPSGEIPPGMPAWSPDSQQIAISSFIAPGGSAIFIANADGSDLRQITEPDGLIFSLAWRPR